MSAPPRVIYMDKFSVVDCRKDIGGDWEYILKSEYDALQTRVAELEAELAKYQWQPIADAPKNRCLIDIWISHSDGGGKRWCDCYYDSICDEWRTITSSGHLISVKARHVSHFMRLPQEPKT